MRLKFSLLLPLLHVILLFFFFKLIKLHLHHYLFSLSLSFISRVLTSFFIFPPACYRYGFAVRLRVGSVSMFVCCGLLAPPLRLFEHLPWC